MYHSSTPGGAQSLGRGLSVLATAGLLLALGSTGAEAKMSPPEQQVRPHEHTEWPEPGQVHPNDDPCTNGGPGADASGGCEDGGDIDGPGDPDGSPQWGGPGERIAVGRDRDDVEAQAEAQDEANEVCHGDWVLRDFVWDYSPTGPVEYTLTYECD